MTERLKDLFFTDEFIGDLGNAIQAAYPGFDAVAFNRLIFSEDWEKKELKQKMYHTTRCMHALLPESYPAALKILREIAPGFRGFNAIVVTTYF